MRITAELRRRAHELINRTRWRRVCVLVIALTTMAFSVEMLITIAVGAPAWGVGKALGIYFHVLRMSTISALLFMVGGYLAVRAADTKQRKIQNFGEQGYCRKVANSAKPGLCASCTHRVWKQLEDCGKWDYWEEDFSPKYIGLDYTPRKERN